MGPAGTVHASLTDWVRFGALHPAAARGTPRLLSTAGFMALHDKQSKRYALGWIVEEDEDFRGSTVWAHDGSDTMWFARVILVPSQDRGCLFGTNASRAGDDAADDAMVALASAGLSGAGLLLAMGRPPLWTFIAGAGRGAFAAGPTEESGADRRPTQGPGHRARHRPRQSRIRQ